MTSVDVRRTVVSVASRWITLNGSRRVCAVASKRDVKTSAVAET
jgi:hypothetical protein